MDNQYLLRVLKEIENAPAPALDPGSETAFEETEFTEEQSSNSKKVSYAHVNKVLEVHFRSGGVYQYFDVPSSVHFDLITAPSHGRFLNNEIKGKYKYERIN